MRLLLALLAVIPMLAAAEMRASEVLGGQLVSAGGEALGRIDDLVFDARSGALRYVVTGRLAFPASALQAEGRERYVLQEPGEAHAVAPLEWPAMRASALINREVIDRQRRDFGEIRDLVVDLDAQRVSSAVIDRADDWQPGRALLTVPIEELSLPRDLADKVALNYSRERFE